MAWGASIKLTIQKQKSNIPETETGYYINQRKKRRKGNDTHPCGRR